jgi:recombination protein RecA
MYGEGISKEGDLVDLAAEKNLLEKSGAWFSYGGERIGQGRENAKQFLRDHADVRSKLETDLRKLLNLPALPEPVSVESGAAGRGKK